MAHLRSTGKRRSRIRRIQLRGNRKAWHNFFSTFAAAVNDGGPDVLILSIPQARILFGEEQFDELAKSASRNATCP